VTGDWLSGPASCRGRDLSIAPVWGSARLTQGVPCCVELPYPHTRWPSAHLEALTWVASLGGGAGGNASSMTHYADKRFDRRAALPAAAIYVSVIVAVARQ